MPNSVNLLKIITLYVFKKKSEETVRAEAKGLILFGHLQTAVG